VEEQVAYIVRVKQFWTSEKVKVKFALEQAMKAQSGVEV
jgi:hypothetical protein